MTSASDGSTSVAVVITTYNHARFLDDAITSVLAQSRAVNELIVVDDGSTDHPERITDRYRTVRLIRQQRSGLAAARNTGWRAAASDFLVFLDADDCLKPNAIEANTTRLLVHPEAAFSYGAYVNVLMDLDRVSGQRVSCSGRRVRRFPPRQPDRDARHGHVSAVRGRRGRGIRRRSAGM